MSISRAISVVLLLALLTACAPIRPYGFAQDIRKNIQNPTYNLPARSNAAEVDLPIQSLPSDAFWVKPSFSGGQLPQVNIKGLSVTEQGVFDVLQVIFSDTGYTLSFEGGPDAATRYGVVTVNNLSGTLTEVMNRLGEIMGFFWTVSDSGVVRIMPEQQFVVSMPPVLAEDSMAGLTNTIQYMGARDVYLDRINRSLVFRANRTSLRAIEGYLEKARQSRSLIVYDMNVLQVDLNDSNNMGVRWELLRGGNVLSADPSAVPRNNPGDFIQGGAATRTATGLDTLILGRNFDTNILVDFLQTQGDVKTLSQPKLGLMNGTNGSIRVGQSTTFVSQVGSQIINGVAQSQATTQQLRTGLQLSLTGEVHDATIYSRINISITELLALKKFTALGVDLNLPEVADRELKTQVRCRPGDTILLGGITVSRSQDDFQTGLAIRSRGKVTKMTELVVTITPKLLHFTQESQIRPAPVHVPEPVPETFKQRVKQDVNQNPAMLRRPAKGEKAVVLTKPTKDESTLRWANKLSSKASVNMARRSMDQVPEVIAKGEAVARTGKPMNRNSNVAKSSRPSMECHKGRCSGTGYYTVTSSVIDGTQ